MKTYAFTFISAAIVALGLTPLVARIALRLGLVDAPGPRKIHTRPIPRIGGIAIILAMLLPVVFVMLRDNAIGMAFGEVQTQIVVILAAGIAMSLVGLVDDVRGLRARFKLFAQLLAATAVCAFGVRIEHISVTGLFSIDFGWAAWPITVLWITGITNAVNLVDGLDGLAAGIAAIASGVIAVLALCFGQPVMAVLMLALMGSLMGFVVHNFNPARIFMGDCGSLFLGFVLGASSVVCATKSAALVGLALPALALGIPIFDTMFSMLRRVLERRSMFSPDRGHFHHRLLALGLKQRHAVIVMYVLTLVAAGLGMFMMTTRSAGTLLVLVSIVLLLALVFRFVGSVRLRETIAALKHNRSITHEATEVKHVFEIMALRVQEAQTFEAWWQALCATAEEMDFVGLSLTLDKGDGADSVVWCHPSLSPKQDEVMRIAIPSRTLRQDVAGRVELDVWTNGSLESASRRVTLFSRLLDEAVLSTGKEPPLGRETPVQTSALALNE